MILMNYSSFSLFPFSPLLRSFSLLLWNVFHMPARAVQQTWQEMGQLSIKSSASHAPSKCSEEIRFAIKRHRRRFFNSVKLRKCCLWLKSTIYDSFSFSAWKTCLMTTVSSREASCTSCINGPWNVSYERRVATVASRAKRSLMTAR